MQEIVRLHTGIHNRLRDWNIDRLYTAEAGYSVPELLEAVLGADDVTLLRAVEQGIVHPRELPPTLTFDEMKERVHGARRKLPSQIEPFAYAPPTMAPLEPWGSRGFDPAAALRARLTALLHECTPSDPPLEIEVWADGDRFTDAAWQLALLARLEAGDTSFALDDGRRAEAFLATPLPHGVAPGALVEWLVEREALRELGSGWFARVQLRIAAQAATATDERPE